ncbi:MAG: hypothetical protein ACLFUT_01670 [Desulfobacteraceae bacterium]
MKHRSRLFILMVICFLVWPVNVLQAGWDPSKPETAADSEIENPVVAQTITRFKHHDPGLKAFFKSAHGYAVFPTITKGGLFIGGACGVDGIFWGAAAGMFDVILT